MRDMQVMSDHELDELLSEVENILDRKEADNNDNATPAPEPEIEAPSPEK